MIMNSSLQLVNPRMSNYNRCLYYFPHCSQDMKLFIRIRIRMTEKFRNETSLVNRIIEM